MQIRNLVKRLFTSNEVQSLAEKILVAIAPLVPPNQVITALSQSLGTALNSLKDARKNGSLNTQTELLMQADEVRDLAFRAFITYVEAVSLRQNPAYAAAGAALQQHIRKFDSRIPYLGYSAESAELNLFFAEMDKATVHLEAISATEWLTELKTAQEEFALVHDGKVDEEVVKSLLEPTKMARENTFRQMVALTQTLNGLAIAGVEGIIPVNQKADQIIEQIEIPARARRTRRQNSAVTEPESEF